MRRRVRSLAPWGRIESGERRGDGVETGMVAKALNVDPLSNVLCRVWILAMGLLLAACVPIPRRHYFSPTLRGVVTRGGGPVEGAELQLIGEFTGKKATTSTNGLGRFEIGPLRGWDAATWLLGDPLYGYTLSIRISGSEYPGLAVFRVGYSPTELEITCDLGKAAI